jgi:hypothetical protein
VQATKTDAAGRFEFTGLSSGTYDLQALADGFLTKTVEDVQVDDQDVGPIQLIAPPGVHSGRCVVALKVPGDLSYEHRSDKTNLVAKILETSGNPLPKATLNLAMAGRDETKRKAQTTRGNFNSLVSVLGSTLYGSRLRAIGANPETCGSPVRI